MKRAYSNTERKHGSSHKRRLTDNVLSSSDVMHFTWNSKEYSRPSLEADIDADTHNKFRNAFESCQISFHESLNRMVRHLKKFGIILKKPAKNAMNIDTQALDSTYIVHLLNSPDNQSICLYSNSRTDSFVYLKGPLFLYAVSQLFQCEIYLFSTRSKALIIRPSNNPENIPAVYILSHTDSYLQRTTYYPLKANENVLLEPEVLQTSGVSHSLVAKKRAEGEKKPRSQYGRLGTSLDKVIVSYISSEVDNFYEGKWRRFKEKEGTKYQDFTELVKGFKKTLSKKSFPNGLIAEVKAKIEKSVKNNEIESFKEKDIPTSAAWFHNKVAQMKKNGSIQPIENYVNEFLESLEQSDDEAKLKLNQDPQPSELDDDVVNDTSEEIRTVSRTLKNIINKEFSHSSLLSRVEALQEDCKKVMIGLAASIKIVIESILSGEILKGTKYQESTLNFSKLDFFKDGLFENDVQVVLWTKEAVEILEEIFTNDGFYKILSTCVGRKNVEKKNDSILNTIIEKMNEEDAFDYKSTPAIQAACKEYFTNFKNMWTLPNYQQDMRVAITLLLRINLARKRFFSKRKIHTKKEKKAEKSKIHHPKISKTFSKIFSTVMKIDKGKTNKVPTLKKLVESLFSPSVVRAIDTKGDQNTPSVVAEAEQSTSGDEDDLSEDDENEIDEDLLDSTNTAPSTIDKDRDLTRKELNALTSVSSMLCSADQIEGIIEPTYVKKQLYLDKQETISDDALEICANIINFLRRFSLKKDENASFITCYLMRRLRNTVVKFANNKTKFNERSLFPMKDNNTSQAIHVNFRTLYLLFQADHTMFKEKDSPFTSSQQIRKDSEKEALFANFLNWEKIKRILQERKLTPSYMFTFNSQYDVIFYGKKNSKKQQAKNEEDVEEEDSVSRPSPADIKSLNEAIKCDKSEYKKLVTRLKNEEIDRMNLGRKHRIREKKKQDWDGEIYGLLKSKRNDCNDIYHQLQVLNTRIKHNQAEMYLLNKANSGQKVKQNSKKLPVSNKLLSRLKKGNALIQGIDPGIVTTASIDCKTSSTLFESINRFRCLQVEEMDSIGEDKEAELVDVTQQIENKENKRFAYDLTAGRVNQATMSNYHRLKREKKSKKSEKTGEKKLAKLRTTRKIRLGRFYKKYISEVRNMAFNYHQVRKNKGSLVSFLGNWSMVGTYIRGHVRRSLKPAVDRWKSVEKDLFFVVDEYKSTITCSSCFKVTTKQIVRTADNKRKRIKGAVVCNNSRCPRRLDSKTTTINRDNNGARNIALIGFSQLVSQDGQVLPPFSRNYAHKYILSKLLTGARVVTSGSPSDGGS